MGSEISALFKIEISDEKDVHYFYNVLLLDSQFFTVF